MYICICAYMSTPNRPQIEAKIEAQIDPKSTQNQLQIDPKSTPNRPKTESEVGGRFWTLFWLRLASSWVVLGALGASLGGLLGRLGSVLGRLGGVLGRLGGLLEHLKPSWQRPRTFREASGAVRAGKSSGFRTAGSAGPTKLPEARGPGPRVPRVPRARGPIYLLERY